jgi:hypothetical protein
MERETFSRILSQLKKRCGIGVNGNIITIPSRAALHAFNVPPALSSAPSSRRCEPRRVA